MNLPLPEFISQFWLEFVDPSCELTPLLGRAEYIHDLSSAPSGGTFCWPLFQVNPMTVYQVEERSQGPGGLRHPWKLCIMLHAISISLSLSMILYVCLYILICIYIIYIHLHMHSIRCHDLCMSRRAPTQSLLPPSSQFPVLAWGMPRLGRRWDKR